MSEAAGVVEVSEAEDEKEQVNAWLRAFNVEHLTEYMRAYEAGELPKFLLVSRDADGGVQGGAFCSIAFLWVRIDLLVVAPEWRGKGIGSALVADAERRGTEAGCRYSYVDTVTFQAPGFYAKQGYREVGRVPNWTSFGHDKVIFVKDLA